MTNDKIEELKAMLQELASFIMQFPGKLDEIEKKVNAETINWTGEARAKKLEQEKEIMTIEFNSAKDQMVKKFDEALQDAFQKIGIEEMKTDLALDELKQTARKLDITLLELNTFLVERAKVVEVSVLKIRDDLFSNLLLRKKLSLGLLPDDIAKQVRKKYLSSTGGNQALTQLKNAREFLVTQIERRSPEEIKQINISSILENTSLKGL